MKFTGTLAALVIGIATAVLTVSPGAAHAADDAVYSHPEPGLLSPVQECPLARPATPADCAGSGSETSATVSVAKRATRSDHQTGADQNDATGKLLEELIKNSD